MRDEDLFRFMYEPRVVKAENGGPDAYEGWCDECGWMTNHRDAGDRARRHAADTGHRTMSTVTIASAYSPRVKRPGDLGYDDLVGAGKIPPTTRAMQGPPE